MLKSKVKKSERKIKVEFTLSVGDWFSKSECVIECCRNL